MVTTAATRFTKLNEIKVQENEYSGEYVCWDEPTGIVRNIPAGMYTVSNDQKTFTAANSVKHSYRNVIKSPIKVAT